MEEEEAGYIQTLVDLRLQELGVPAVVLEMLINRLTLEVLEVLDKVLMEEMLLLLPTQKVLVVVVLEKLDLIILAQMLGMVEMVWLLQLQVQVFIVLLVVAPVAIQGLLHNMALVEMVAVEMVEIVLLHPLLMALVLQMHQMDITQVQAVGVHLMI
jgi:hypothetical protein